MSYDETDRNRRNPSHGDPSGPADGIHPAGEILSEYLDQAPELAQAERDAIDHHLIGCEQCQRVLNELQLMVRTLGSLPETKAPRSFALRPEALEPAKTPKRPAPVVLQESAQWHERHAAKVRWATAVAAMLFVFVISADLVTNGVRGADDSAPGVAQPEMMQSSDAASGGTTPAAASGASEIPTAEIEREARTTGNEAPEPDAEVPASDGSTVEEAEDEAEIDTFMLPSDDAEDREDTGDDEAAVPMSQELISEEPASEAQAGGDSSQMRWRIAEVSLALLLAVLLAVMIGLPKQRGRRRR